MFVSYIIHEYDKKTCHCLIIPTACCCHSTVHRWDFLEEKNNKQLVFLIYNTTTIKTSEQQETPFKQVFWYVQL